MKVKAKVPREQCINRIKNDYLEKASSLEQIYPDELLELFQSQHLPEKDSDSAIMPKWKKILWSYDVLIADRRWWPMHVFFLLSK